MPVPWGKPLPPGPPLRGWAVPMESVAKPHFSTTGAGRTQHVGLNAEPLRPYASFLMLPIGLTPVLCSLGHLHGCLSSAPREGCLFPHPPLLSAVEGRSGWDAEKSITWGKGKIISFLTDRSDLSFKTPAGGKWHNLP